MTETTKYTSMLTSFAADFTLARDFIHSLSEFDVLLEERNPVFMKDIELLDELDFNLRHGKLKIVEVTDE